MFKQSNHSHRRCRNKAIKISKNSSHIKRVESINILLGVDSLNNLYLLYVLGKRKLNNEPVNGRVGINLRNLSKQSLLCNIILKTNNLGGEAHLVTSLSLIGNIGLAATIVSNQNSRKMRNTEPPALIIGHHLRNLLLNLSRGCLAIQNRIHLSTK